MLGFQVAPEGIERRQMPGEGVRSGSGVAA
jgi:hypothetical protein